MRWQMSPGVFQPCLVWCNSWYSEDGKSHSQRISACFYWERGDGDFMWVIFRKTFTKLTVTFLVRVAIEGNESLATECAGQNHVPQFFNLFLRIPPFQLELTSHLDLSWYKQDWLAIWITVLQVIFNFMTVRHFRFYKKLKAVGGFFDKLGSCYSDG